MSATAAQVYVNGPAEIHVGASPSGTLTFFGWSEAGVRLTFDAAYEDVPSDISGTRIPFDVQYMANQAFIAADVNVFKETTFEGLLSRNSFTGLAGFINASDVGSLVRLEELAVRLMIYSPYAASKAASFADMAAGYNFLVAYLMDAVDLEIGSKYKRTRMIWRAIPFWNDNGVDPYRATLFNHVVTGRTAPTVLPVPS